MGCEHCATKDREIKWLRTQIDRAQAQVEKAQDQLTMVVNPGAWATMHGHAPVGGPPPTVAGPDGTVYVQLGDRLMPLTEYEKMLSEKGLTQGHDGAFHPAEEVERVERKLSEFCS